VKNWAAGHDGKNGKVHPDVQAAAAKAVAEWEAAKAGSGKAARSMTTPTGTTMDADYDNDYDPAGCDADGLNSSWDGDLSDLPAVDGLSTAHFDAAEQAVKNEPGWQGRVHGQHQTLRADVAPLGTGARFKKLSAGLAAKGAHDPDALAAWIGKKKYGKAGFKKLANAARKAHGGASRAGTPGELVRFYPLEDIHILTRSEGDGSGRVVEAYATVFDQPAEIHDYMGHYMEEIDRTAFDQVLAKIARTPGGLARAVKVLYNHGKTAEGTPAPEFQVPIGTPLDVRPETRGLLTRTEYDAGDPFTERILSKIRSGAINSQSFVGGIVRSSPELQGPGDRYRKRGGALTTVRRMQLGLREYGPVLWPAYSGAEILGVRMQLPGSDEGPDLPDEEYGAEGEASVTGGVPEDTTSARYHQHALYRLRSQEAREARGIVFKE
jgi:phage head maturation protease